MAKRGGNRGGMAGGGNMQNLLRQAQQMQKDMEVAQGELSTMEFEAASGGGMITAKVNGAKELLSINIKPEAVDPDDVEMLEDMIVAAIHEAVGKADKETQQKMGKFSAGMPGMF
ncbi:MAG: YbaB/EbfC family nucleoid-associated protein [Clostridiales bacterium]|nr:YbaB/EbfC family nucleoid-associated protein [Clostridiales bacterium]